MNSPYGQALSCILLIHIGAYSCVGKNLALMELRSVISAVVREFDISFAPGEDGTSVVAKAKDTFTLSPGDLHLRFHPVKI